MPKASAVMATAWLFSALVIRSTCAVLLPTLGCVVQGYTRACGSVPGRCNPKWEFKVLEGSMVVNNLGGKGPEHADKELMILTDVFPDSGQTIDLEVKALGSYTPGNASENRVNNGFLQFSVAAGTNLSVGLTFRSRRTRELFHVPRGLFTFAGLERVFSEDSPTISAKDFDGYFVTTHSTLAAQARSAQEAVFTPKAADDQRMVMLSRTRSEFESSSLDAFDVSSPAWNKAFTVLYSRVSELTFDFTAPGTRSNHPGHTFLLSGSSEMACQEQQHRCREKTCPVETHILRPFAKGRRCASLNCDVASDINRCCKLLNENECKVEHTVDIRPNSVLYSNICGMGPDKGRDRKVIYADVLPYSVRTVDLHVRKMHGNCDVRRYNSSRNGVDGAFGTLGVVAGKWLEVEFSFVDRKTQEVVRQMQPYLMSFMGIDFSKTSEANANDRGIVEVSGFNASYLPDPSDVVALGDGRFEVSREDRFPFDIRAVKNPHALSPYHSKQAISFKFTEPKWTAKFRLYGKRGSGSRSFYFGGGNNVVCPQKALCSTMKCPEYFVPTPEAALLTCSAWRCGEKDVDRCCTRPLCDNDNRLHLSRGRLRVSNLGGLGPESNEKEALVYRNVFPHQPGSTDLEVSVDDTYKVGTPSMNGVSGDFGRIHMEPGLTSTFNFRFFQHGLPYHVKPFLLSVSTQVNTASQSNATEGLDPADRSRVTINGAEWVALTTNTQVAYSLENGTEGIVANLTYADELETGNADLPTHAFLLNDQEVRRAATVLMPSSQHFKMSYRVGSNLAGGDLLFAGASNLLCSTRQLCSEFPCPPGYYPRHMAKRIPCNSWPCNRDDIEACCRASEAPASEARQSEDEEPGE